MQHVRHLDPTRISVEARDRNGDDQCRQGARARAARSARWRPASAPISRCSILNKPYVGVLHRPISTFVCAGKGSDARVVMVDGEIVYRDGAFPRASRHRVIRRSRADRRGHSRAQPAWAAAWLRPGGSATAPRMDVIVDNVTKIWGRGSRRRGCARPGFASVSLPPLLLHPRTERLRQEHAAPDRRRIGAGHVRHRADPAIRHRAQMSSPARRRFGDGLAEPQPVSLAQRHRQCRLRPRDARRCRGPQRYRARPHTDRLGRTAAGSRIICPDSCRAACASASRSPAP